MRRYYEIIQIRDKFTTPKDVIKLVSMKLNHSWRDDNKIYRMMGYENPFDMFRQAPSDNVIARKLNDICKEYKLNIRIGGGYYGVRPQRSIFR